MTSISLLVGIVATAAIGTSLIALASTLIGLAGFVGLVRHGKANAGEVADRIEKRTREATRDVRSNPRDAAPIAASEDGNVVVKARWDFRFTRHREYPLSLGPKSFRH